MNILVLLAVLSACLAEELPIESSYSFPPPTNHLALRSRPITRSSPSSPFFTATPHRILSTPQRTYSSPIISYFIAPTNTHSSTKSIFPALPKRYSTPKPSYSSPKPSYSAPQPSYSSPKPSYSAPKPSYSAPKPSYSSPKPSYSEPKPSYSAPKPSYSAPKPSYSAPKPSYLAPKPSYSAPKPSYSAPKPSYSAPKPSYSAPKPSYSAPHETYIGKSVVPILKDDREHNEDGSYSFSLLTGDGISRQEKGTPVYTKEGPVTAITGSYSYTLPNGQVFELRYVADENGFQPQSNFLPVAPAFPHPIPAHALEQIERGRREHEARARKDLLKKQSSSGYTAPSSHRRPSSTYGVPS